LNEKTQRKVFDYLQKKFIKNFVGVPDSTLKFFIDQGFKKKKIIIANREEEAIGIATGLILAKSPSLVFMQNAGFANSLSTITSLVQLYEIPMLFLIGWRGYLHNDAPEHEKIGKIQPQLLDSLDLENKTLTEKTWKKNCDWALSKIKQNKSAALIIRRDFLD
jgi:sulfopyruvate decarboxylase TPP-binding subunit|tara:strand:- start:2851 stop:3339 length:489 start_codon:yes stop_codon:yes gene_type:complete